MPASYPANGTGPEGLTAEIVDCGTGFAWDYEDVDMEGMIALVAMDWNEGKGSVFANTSEATISLLEKAAAMEEGSEIDSFDDEIAIYLAELDQQTELYRESVAAEIDAINALTGKIQ